MTIKCEEVKKVRGLGGARIKLPLPLRPFLKKLMKGSWGRGMFRAHQENNIAAPRRELTASVRCWTVCRMLGVKSVRPVTLFTLLPPDTLKHPFPSLPAFKALQAPRRHQTLDGLFMRTLTAITLIPLINGRRANTFNIIQTLYIS